MGRSFNLLNNMKGGPKDVQNLNDDEDIDNGLCEEEAEIGGEKVSQFVFSGEGSSVSTIENLTAGNTLPLDEAPVTTAVKPKATPKGITPSIDGESFDIKRSYQFRESTLRMLNELKANHPDINVYLNTIVDAAIRHYHHYVVIEGNPQK